MKSLLLMALLFSSKFALAQTIVSYVPTGNILFCDQQADIISAHNSYLRQIKVVTALRDATPKDSEKYAQLDSLLLTISKGSESTRDLVAQFDNSLLATIIVNIDVPKTISSQKVGGQVGEGKILISPSAVSDDSILISPSVVEIKFYGLRFCNALSDAGKNGLKAAQLVVSDLFK